MILNINMKTVKSPSISILRTALLVGAVLGVVMAIAVVVGAFRSGTFSSPLQLLAPAGVAEGITDSMPRGVEYGQVVVDAVSSQQRSWAVVVAVVDAALYLLAAVMLYLLGRVFTDAEAGHPFSAANVRRMSGVAWLSTGFAVVAFYAKPFALSWASSQIGAGAWTVSASFLPVFMVVVGFALAGIWRTGAELADFEEHAI